MGSQLADDPPSSTAKGSATPPGQDPEPQGVPVLAEQGEIDTEIAHLAQLRSGQQLDSPMLDYPPYRSSQARHPLHPAVRVEPDRLELAGPTFGPSDIIATDADLTIQHRGQPLGERMVITGRVQDSSGRAVAHQLVEIWQANSAGRYIHQRDQHPAPLDPNFTGLGRCLTDDDGWYRFVTIKPGPYPWRNHHNAWRPAHIHFSLFGTSFTQRLVTQMYFPGDPLMELDPICRSIGDPRALARLVATYDHSLTVPEWSTGYRWDVVLDGPSATWREQQ